jgi:hypothetical protein
VQLHIVSPPTSKLTHGAANPQIVIPAKAGIQYTAAARLDLTCAGILDRPVKPDDDNTCAPNVICRSGSRRFYLSSPLRKNIPVLA